MPLAYVVGGEREGERGLVRKRRVEDNMTAELSCYLRERKEVKSQRGALTFFYANQNRCCGFGLRKLI
jgi:hypothetical protein